VGGPVAVAGRLRPGVAGVDHPGVTESADQTPAASPSDTADPTRWADAVTELQRLRRDETAAEERDEWAAAADLRVLFASHRGSTAPDRA